ncbi:MAG: Pr6Pr family membrane protein [Bacillus subtilis]|nr:Pr6Pr family membrane protein [Bacillus subtilis]
MKAWSIRFKLLIVLTGLVGIVLNAIDADNILELFSYYAIQSNLYVVILFSVLVGFEIKKRPWEDAWKRVFKGMFTIGILVTMLVYHVLLKPGIAAGNIDYEVGGLPDVLVHTMTPLLVILDWLLFDKKGLLKAYYPLLWLLQPVDYLVYVLIFTALGGRFTLGVEAVRYPYFFLDIDRFGFVGVLQWSILILLLYVVLGYLLYFIDGVVRYFELKRDGIDES